MKLHDVELHEPDASATSLGTRVHAHADASVRQLAHDVLLRTHWTRILYCDRLDGSAQAVDDDRMRKPPALSETDRPTSGASRVATSAYPGETVRLSAADDYQLVAMRYGSSAPVHANLVVAGAVGVPQRFYRRFATFAASRGYGVMTLDYRGIGLSAPATLKGFRMDYFDWGRLDLAAAVDAMSEPGIPLYVVGHSFGGHGFGMLPNHGRVAGFYTFGTGAGWHGWMSPVERLKVLALWHVLGPVLTACKGYLAWSLVGMGADVPLDYYRRWKQWCRHPDYFFGDATMRYLSRTFARIRAPIVAANATDDAWAPPRSRDAFVRNYRNARLHAIDIDPARHGLRAIGHMGYFKSFATPLWERALMWIDAHARNTLAAPGRNHSASVHAAAAAGSIPAPSTHASLESSG